LALVIHASYYDVPQIPGTLRNAKWVAMRQKNGPGIEKTPGTFSASFEKRRIWDLRFKLNWINLSTKGLTPGLDPNRITLASLWNARAAEVKFTL
jgi:hypothetical protein